MNKSKVKIIFSSLIIALLAVFVYVILISKTTGEGIVQTALMDINSKVAGKIIELNLENNKQVQKGEILIQLDTKKYEKEIDDISKNLEDLKVENSLSLKDLNDMAALVEEGKEEVKLARLRLENANEDVVRYKNSLKDGVVTQADYKNSLENLNTAKAQFDALQDELKENEEIYSSLISKKATQENLINDLSEKIKTAELNLTYTTISAPVDGVIINTKAKIGQEVKKDAVLASIVPLKCYIVADFNTSKIFKIKKGQRVDIFIEQNKFEGCVDEILSVGDKITSAKIIFSHNESNKEILAGTKANLRTKLF